MTCIVAVAEKGQVWMGADSAATDPRGTQVIRREPKVFKLGDAVVGVAGSFRAAQVIRYSAPPVEKHRDMHRYLCTEWIESLREAMGEAVAESETETFEGALLIGISGAVWQVEADYHVGRSVQTFDAVGSGAQVALGSLLSTKGLEPDKRVKLALEAAEAFCASVRRPWRMETTA